MEVDDRPTWRAARPDAAWRVDVQDVITGMQARRGLGHGVTRVPLAEVNGWSWDLCRLRHASGRFFTVRGYDVRCAGDDRLRCVRPLVDQPEIGLLGVVSAVEDGVRYLLLQAKFEPGNANLVQLSPTVQATRSNQARVHQGTAPAYLEHFLPGASRVLVDQLQSEQSTRFFAKRNRNVLVEVPERIPARPGFFWLTLGQVRALLRRDELVNMDTRSVLSCLSTAAGATGDDLHVLGRFGAALVRGARWTADRRPKLLATLRWLSAFQSTVERHTEIVPLRELPGWTVDGDAIAGPGGRPFSVIGVAVEAPDREVARWMQPIVEHRGVGVLGWLARVRDGEVELLCRATFAPGGRDPVEISCTVRVDAADELDGEPLGGAFVSPDPSRVRFDAIQSEEGGRFLAYRSRYLVVEADDVDVAAPDDHLWLTPAELHELARIGCLAIEARNLLACLDPFADVG